MARTSTAGPRSLPPFVLLSAGARRCRALPVAFERDLEPDVRELPGRDAPVVRERVHPPQTPTRRGQGTRSLGFGLTTAIFHDLDPDSLGHRDHRQPDVFRIRVDRAVDNELMSE